MPHKDPEVRRAYERKRHRRRAESRREQGLCPKCGRDSPAPGRSLCDSCLGKSRAAERARYLERKIEGSAYGGRCPESRRRMARERARKRRRERLEAGRCTTCGEREPAGGAAVCGDCRQARRAAEKMLYEKRRASGQCGRCGLEVIDKASMCASCAARDVKRRPKKNAASRKRYRDRRALGICVDCQSSETNGASRCEKCAKRSYLSSGEHRGMPVFAPRYTIIELETGIEHGPLDSWEEVAMCLAFKRLSRDEIEVVEDAPLISGLAGW